MDEGVGIVLDVFSRRCIQRKLNIDVRKAVIGWGVGIVVTFS